METPAHQYSLLKPPAWLERLTGRSLAVGAVAAFVPFGLLLAMERFFPAYAVQFLYTGMALSALLGIFRVAYFWRHRRHTEFDKDLQNIIICAAGGTFTYRLVALAGGGGLLAFLVLTCWHYVAVGVLRKVYGVPLVTPGPLSGTGLDGVDDAPLPGDE